MSAKRRRMHRTRLGFSRKSSGKTRRNAQVDVPKSQYDRLIKKITSQPRNPQPRQLELQDILYNSAPELRSLAFKSGHNVGAEAYASSGRENITALEHLLEHAGFGKVIYHSFESMSTLTSYSPGSAGINLGMSVHIFEAGLISGYFSALMGQRIGVQETACKLNGATHCMFVARAGSSVSAEAHKHLDLSSMVSALRHALSHAEKHNAEKSYYMLALRPLLSEPVFSEAAKFMYLAGKLLVRQFPAEPEKTIVQAASFLKISGARLSVGGKKRKGIALSLVYDHETSSGRFVDLTVAFISGIMKGAYGGKVQVSRGVNSRGVYIVKLEILQGAGVNG
jgi:predicted hydrocarbon binding protein